MNRAKAELWRRRFALIYLFGSWNLLGYVIYAYPIGKNSRQSMDHPSFLPVTHAQRRDVSSHLHQIRTPGKKYIIISSGWACT